MKVPFFEPIGVLSILQNTAMIGRYHIQQKKGAGKRGTQVKVAPPTIHIAEKNQSTKQLT
jgi:hypothetical protein